MRVNFPGVQKVNCIGAHHGKTVTYGTKVETLMSDGDKAADFTNSVEKQK